MVAAIRVAQQQQVGFRLVVVHRDGTDGITYNLLGDQIDIGRTEGDLLFDDPHLAPRHARIVASLTGRVLTPLEGRNGVYVRLRGPVDLQDGDSLLLGKQVLRFELVPEIERTVRPAIEHGVVLFGTPVRPPWARLRQITPAGVGRDVYHLTRPDVVMGRESGDFIFSDDEFMSRRHAQIGFRNGRGYLEDLGSSNGTFLRLRGPHGLTSGDLIRLGDELLRFEIG
jgi:pSer/pThr/pTyr-binding forkhead associated (FHA) protein